MASSREYFDEIAKLVVCHICLERLNDPRVLKCTHSFCKDCINKMLLVHNEKCVIKCPLRCKHDTVLSRGKTAGDLLSSIELKNILTYLEETEERIASKENLDPLLQACEGRSREEARKVRDILAMEIVKRKQLAVSSYLDKLQLEEQKLLSFYDSLISEHFSSYKSEMRVNNTGDAMLLPQISLQFPLYKVSEDNPLGVIHECKGNVTVKNATVTIENKIKEYELTNQAHDALVKELHLIIEEVAGLSTHDDPCIPNKDIKGNEINSIGNHWKVNRTIGNEYKMVEQKLRVKNAMKMFGYSSGKTKTKDNESSNDSNVNDEQCCSTSKGTTNIFTST